MVTNSYQNIPTGFYQFLVTGGGGQYNILTNISIFCHTTSRNGNRKADITA
jgi:hypothetical protein